MSKRLALYGNEDQSGSVAAVGVGKKKSSRLLARRLPSRDLLAKVGGEPLPDIRSHSLVRLKAR